MGERDLPGNGLDGNGNCDLSVGNVPFTHYRGLTAAKVPR